MLVEAVIGEEADLSQASIETLEVEIAETTDPVTAGLMRSMMQTRWIAAARCLAEMDDAP